MLKQSYKMLSSKLVAVKNSLSYRQCRPARVSANRTLAEQDLRRVCSINTIIGPS